MMKPHAAQRLCAALAILVAAAGCAGDPASPPADTTAPTADVTPSADTLGPEMAARWSRQMDFSGPDRNPDLGAVLWYHMKGAPPPGSHLARAMAGLVPPVPRTELDEDDADAFDRGWAQTRAHLLAHPDVLARIPVGTLPAAIREVEAHRR